MRPRGLVLAVLALAGTSPPAHAADPPQPASLGVKPFTVTPDTAAHKPNVAVDETGTGHFTWNVNVNPGDDPAVYCRIPRGATACQAQQTFNLPLEAFGEPQVLAPGPGQVILITYRCCGKGEGTYAIISTDGGNTFAEPRLVGTIEPGQAVYGPGTGAVSLVDDVVTAGIHYQAAPLDGFTDKSAKVGEGGATQGYDGTIGFPAPNVPIVAFDDLANGYWRGWSGAGDVNDITTWGPTQPLGPLKETRMATGVKGVVLMGKQHFDDPYRDVYVARRFDPASSSFGPAVQISDPKVETDVIFRDIFEDGGGNIAAVWIANGVHAGKADPLRYRASVDGGKTWLAERTLSAATDDAGFNLQMGAAPDGGGWVVYDDNSKGPLVAVPIPPLAQQGTGAGATPGAGCPGSVTFGKVQVIALAGCLKKGSGAAYTTDDPVRVNGVDVIPHSSGKVVVDTAKKKIHIDAADVRAGNIVLDKGSFDWNAASAAVTTFAHLEKFKVSIFGFPVAGEATLQFTDKGALIPAHLELPSIFGGVNADVTLRLKNPDGLQLDGFKLHVGDVFLGALRVKPLDVEYKGSQPPIFEGSAKFLLPPSYSEPGVSVGFGFVNGQFKHAEGSFPLQLQLFPPWLYLQKIGLALSTGPLKVAGGVLMTGGPQILGSAALSIDALPESGGGFSFELGDPAILRLAGKLSVVSVPFASGFVEYRTNGLLKFGGGLDFTAPLDVASVTAGVPQGPPLGPGFLDLTNGRFNAPFEGHVCVPAGCGFIDVGSKGVVSSTGIAACGEYLITKTPEIGVSAGFGYKWGQGVDVFADLGGCDVAPYAATAVRRVAGLRQASSTITVPNGLPQENIVIRGAPGAAPRVTVAGPGGETVSSSADGTPVTSAHMVVFSNNAAGRTYVLIGQPVGGAYTVSAQEGSPAIASVVHADGLPEPQVSGVVTGRAYARTLSYEVTAIKGQTVRFVERADGAAAEIGEAKAASGKLRFTPTDGPKGARQIVAVVDQDGIPRRDVVIGTYAAPGPRKPGRPRFVRARRSGSGLRVTWGTAARASRYVVRVRLHDGTSRLYVTGSKKRSLKIAHVPARTFGSITVAARSKTGVAGPSRKASVKRKKARKRR